MKMTLANRLRLFVGRPFKPEQFPDGLAMTDVPNQGWWDRRPEPPPTCQLCGAPATQFKITPPWPGTTYTAKTFACDAHASYLDGHHWIKCSNNSEEGEWQDVGRTDNNSFCTVCDAPYGSCEHTARYAAMARAQEEGAVHGRL